MIAGTIFWGFVVLAFGGALLWSGFSALGRKRLVEDTPTSKIRSLAMGRVEVYGAVVPAGETVKAPLSNKECVWYRYAVEEYRQQGKSGKWVTIKSGTEGKRFNLKDDTGQVLVDLKGAEFDVPETYKAASKWGTDPPKEVLAFLKSNKISFEGLLGINKSMRFTEHAIAPGDKLYIMATAGEKPGVKGSAKQASAEHTENLMLQQGKNDTFYYISTKSEKDVRKSLGWQVAMGWFFGAALVVGGVGMMLVGVFGSE